MSQRCAHAAPAESAVAWPPMLWPAMPTPAFQSMDANTGSLLPPAADMFRAQSIALICSPYHAAQPAGCTGSSPAQSVHGAPPLLSVQPTSQLSGAAMTKPHEAIW